MRLKDLHLLAGDDGAPDTADQFLRFAAEHDSGDDFDPTWAGGLLEHGPTRYTPGGGRGSPDILRFFGGYPRVIQQLCGFSGAPPQKGRNCKAFTTYVPPQGDRSEQG